MSDLGQENSGWKASLGWLALGAIIVLVVAGVFVFG